MIFLVFQQVFVVVVPENGWELIESSTGVRGETEYAEFTDKPVKYIDYKTKKFVKKNNNVLV